MQSCSYRSAIPDLQVLDRISTSIYTGGTAQEALKDRLRHAGSGDAAVIGFGEWSGVATLLSIVYRLSHATYRSKV